VTAPRIVVTGGSGFIGRHVARALRARGADVTVADKRREPDGHPAVIVDLTAPGAVERAIKPGTDAIVHLAAITSVLGSIKHPAETFETNVTMTAAILERARRVGVSTVVFASTNAVVGHASDAVITEDTALHPLTPYGATKAAAEMLLSAYTAAYDVRGVPLRLSNVYGPGMDAKDSIIPRIIRAARAGAGFDVYGDGHQVRDYVHVDDVVGAMLLALDTDVAGPLVIGSGVSSSVLDVLALARTTTGAALPARHVPAKVGEMRRVVVDPSRARALGWSSGVDLDAGLADAWHRWTDDADASIVALA
jgi:UDP-glucose 4-epimerase